METPDGRLPISSVAMTLGGEALRSITDIRLSGTVLVGSPGSIFIAAVTSASPSSGVIATLSGGPTTLTGAWTSAMTRGGLALRSMMATVSGGGFGTTLTLPLTLTTLLSLADTAICALTVAATATSASSMARMRDRWAFIVTSLWTTCRLGLRSLPSPTSFLPRGYEIEVSNKKHSWGNESGRWCASKDETGSRDPAE